MEALIYDTTDCQINSNEFRPSATAVTTSFDLKI